MAQVITPIHFGVLVLIKEMQGTFWDVKNKPIKNMGYSPYKYQLVRRFARFLKHQQGH